MCRVLLLSFFIIGVFNLQSSSQDSIYSRFSCLSVRDGWCALYFVILPIELGERNEIRANYLGD